MSNERSKGEQGFQRHIIDSLTLDPHWVERKAKSDYDRNHAVDRGMLEEFLRNTQPDGLAVIERAYGDRAIDVIIAEYEKACRAKGTAQIDVLRSGVDVNSVHIDLLYGKPATGLNPDLSAKYEANRLSVMEEVWIDDSSRIDLVMFINGIAWAAIELKYTPEGFTWRDAVHQWTYERDHKNRLVEWQVGTIVNFAMDENECHMTTQLKGDETRFIPFNRGRGEGINQGEGNPAYGEDGVADYPTHYVWDDVLTRDSVLELLTKFAYVERKEEEDQLTGKRRVKEAVIFPRYHQRDALHALLDDVFSSKSDRNYLVQHSAGSGKTNTIAWLAHRLASFHGDDGVQVFDTVVVGTNRKVVDRQLQAAVKSLERKTGLVRVMDEDCTSEDLSNALFDKAKIIVTTIQKFMYVEELAGRISDRRFAMIIDEAHNATAGRNMVAIQNAMGGEEEQDEEDATDVYERLVRNHGKRRNLSVFAFTATPKPRTLKLFGTPDAGNPEFQRAFHTYSMKQAIEEGFILDVLQNYVEYKTLYKVSKAVDDDPLLHSAAAKREIARVAELDDTNINQRVGIIVEHFRRSVLGKCGLGGREKAMVVTGGREDAGRYRQALQDYVDRHHYSDVRALVAFSGKVAIDEAPYPGIGAVQSAKGWEYTEHSMNGFSETKTADNFDTDAYNVLLVANKFQVGFDQPKLCAMYIMRKLRDVDAVQTLSRLNRVIPGKSTVVVDFVNTCKDMERAFARFYTTTVLSNTVTVSQLLEYEMQLDGYNVIDDADIDGYARVVKGAATKKLTGKEAAKADGYVRRAKTRLENMYHGDLVTQGEFRMCCSGFTRLYEFLSLASTFGDTEMEKKYAYVRDLLEILKTGGHGGVSVRDKINFEHFEQKEIGDTGTKGNAHPSNPMVVLPGVSTHLTEDEHEHLSEILAVVNVRVGGDLDSDVASLGGLQVKELLLKQASLRASALANSEEDFEIAYFDAGEDVLYKGLNQNNQFFGEILKDEVLLRKFLGLYVHDIYKTLRKEGQANG